MVIHEVFGVERDIDIDAETFPSCEEIRKSEERTMPRCEHGWLKSCYKGYRLHYRKMVPPDGRPARAIVIWMHGLNSHGGVAYVVRDGRKFGIALKHHGYVEREGCALYTLDLLGFGLSEGERGIMPNHEVLVRDYINFVELVSSFHEPGTPLFLTGGSFGATLTLHVAHHFQQQPTKKDDAVRDINIDSLILFAPAVLPDSWLYFVLLHFLIFVLRWFVAPYFPTRVKSLRPYDPSLRWRDPEVLRHNMNDKLRRFDPRPMQTNLTILVAVQKLFGVVRSNSSEIDALPPYCVIHGEGDKVVPMDGCQYLLSGTRGITRQFNAIPNALHDLLGDPASEDVMDIAIQWTRRRLSLLQKQKHHETINFEKDS